MTLVMKIVSDLLWDPRSISTHIKRVLQHFEIQRDTRDITRGATDMSHVVLVTSCMALGNNRRDPETSAVVFWTAKFVVPWQLPLRGCKCYQLYHFLHEMTLKLYLEPLIKTLEVRKASTLPKML